MPTPDDGRSVTEHDGYKVGGLYWMQLWSPVHEPKTIKYGPRKIMKLAGIVLNWTPNGDTRWWLVDPARPNDESKMSWVESDWCDLEPAAEDLGMLF